ncbi:MAG: hypothetical protein IIX61_06900 [Loktanella sp.]|nr:hypothetical protein [Loktanella sp.]
MKVLAVFLCGLMLPIMALAQPLTVLTGEHDRFTRVVVRLPAGAEWQFGRTASGYGLRLPVTEGYNLGRFFDLIPRSRISNVSQDATNGSLFMELACECRAAVEVIDSGFLVIDISTGPADADSPFEALIFGDEQNSLLAEAKASTDDRLKLPVILLRQPMNRIDPAIFGFPSGNGAPQEKSADEELRALEERVIDGLGRGLSSGLLTPDLQQVPVPLTVRRDLPAPPLPGMAVLTGDDPLAIPQASNPSLTADGTACVPDAILRMTDWSDGRTMAEQLGPLRSAVTHEFDRIDPVATENLARLYLYFGFGREAMQMLALDGGASQERIYLRTIAQIIDDDPVALPDLNLQLTCRSSISLWAFLANTDEDTNASADLDAVLGAFKDLSLPLQRHLGPRLAEKFIMTGQDDAARQVLSAAITARPDAVETRLAGAIIASQSGEAEDALQTLADLAQNNARIPVRAMTKLLTESVTNDRPIAESEMAVADGLRFEQAGEAEVIALAAAQIRAHLAMGAFADAAQILQSQRSRFDPDTFAALQREFGLTATEKMPDVAFLAFAISPARMAEATDVQNRIAERLIMLGFPDGALNLLLTRDAPDDKDGLYLRATALLALRNPEAVLRLLRDDSAPRAANLRQAARDLRAGNPTAALSLSDTAPVESDWRNGQWSSLAAHDDALLRDVAAVILDTEGFDPATNAPLSDSRALLDAAAESRGLVSALLDRFALPTDD